MEKDDYLLEKLLSAIQNLQERRMKLLNTLKNRDDISFNEIITKGKELELLLEKIWTIEEVIHG